MNPSVVEFRWSPALLITVFLVGGCAHPIMPPPNVYGPGGKALYPDPDAVAQTNDVEVLYFTDRVDESEVDGVVEYGKGRSGSMAFGVAIVSLGRELSWDQLLEYSNLERRSPRPKLRLEAVEELVRLPPTPLPYRPVGDGRIAVGPATLEQQQLAEERIRGELENRLANTPRKEAFVVVHGVDNSFQQSVQLVAEGWHFMGREGLHICYTWPAGKSYGYDRESGEFTVHHLKQMLRLLASTPALERVHVLAHSRGTDIAMTALRELIIEARAAGRDPRETYKLGIAVMAAPDIDFHVTMQRYVAEAVAPAFERISLYASGRDTAVGAASILTGSDIRLGRARPENMTTAERDALTLVDNFDLIVYDGRRGGDFGHSYFRDNPAVSADLVMLMRYGALPGAEHGRPLTPLGDRFWTIGDDYLLPTRTP